MKKKSFVGDKAFLSNMYPCEVHTPYGTLNGTYKCSEAYYQIHKIKHPTFEDVKYFQTLNGYEAKKEGKKLNVREDWDKIKYDIMVRVVKAKFDSNPDLLAKLINIKGDIVEENYWNDTYWGTCNGEGLNSLGVILMQVRDEYRITHLKLDKRIINYYNNFVNKYDYYIKHYKPFENDLMKVKDVEMAWYSINPLTIENIKFKSNPLNLFVKSLVNDFSARIGDSSVKLDTSVLVVKNKINSKYVINNKTKMYLADNIEEFAFLYELHLGYDATITHKINNNIVNYEIINNGYVKDIYNENTQQVKVDVEQLNLKGDRYTIYFIFNPQPRFIRKNLYDSLNLDYKYICFTSNGVLKGNKELVMGAGNAKVVREKYNGLAKRLGTQLLSGEYEKINGVYKYGILIDDKTNIIALQTKLHFKDKSTVELIKYSLDKLKILKDKNPKWKIALPLPGISNGGLDVEDILPLLPFEFDYYYLGDRRDDYGYSYFEKEEIWLIKELRDSLNEKEHSEYSLNIMREKYNRLKELDNGKCSDFINEINKELYTLTLLIDKRN